MRYLKLRVKYRDGPVPPDMTFRWSVFFEAVKDWKTYLVASLLAFGGSVPTYSVNYTLATVNFPGSGIGKGPLLTFYCNRW